MSIDTQIYLYIILSGFITVWTFRYLKGSQQKLDNFEYLGFSAFWGLIILVLYEFYIKWRFDGDMEKFNRMFSNPFATGLVLSLFAPLLAFIGYKIFLLFKWFENKNKRTISKIKKIK